MLWLKNDVRSRNTLLRADPLSLAIGGTRLVLGAATYVAPSIAGTAFEVDVAQNPQAPFVARLYAARDAAIGIATITASGSARRTLTAVGAATDLGDAVAAVLAYRRGMISRSTAMKTVASAMVVGGLSTASYLRGRKV